MFGFSMIQMVRRHSYKLDAPIRQELINLYRPMRWIPCFMHPMLEKMVKSRRKFPVIIEMEKCEGESHQTRANEIESVISRHPRCIMHHQFPSIQACSCELTATALEELLTTCSYIKKVYTDRPVQALLDVATPTTKAHLVQRSGLTGKGITVAIIDTGIYPHRDLVNPTNRLVAFKDFMNNRTDAYDDNGHGTHCAGDAAGNGFASHARYVGPAPDATLIGVKVLDRAGAGSLSTVIAGVQWCIDNREKYGINVLSLSLGSTAAQPAADDPVVRIVEQAWEMGMVVCVAAGNFGPDQRTIASPGISPKAITVGALDDKNTPNRADDTVADFSSRGPTIDGLMKPDVLAPGVNIISWRSPKSYLDKLSKSSRVEQDYFTLSGTSMATPICAGIAALVLQSNPNLTPDQVKQTIMDSAEDMGLLANVQGKGSVHAEQAVFRL